MKELSIFIDESGMFGDFDAPTKAYQITFVFHDQSKDISRQLKNIENFLRQSGLPKDFIVHSGPLIFNKNKYKTVSFRTRRKILETMFYNFKKMPILVKTFRVEKRYASSIENIYSEFILKIKEFIEKNYDYFSDFDAVKVYYDRGRREISSIIAKSICKSLNNTIFKHNISHENYRLLQIADMVCEIDLINYKTKNKTLTKSDKIFFGNYRDFKRLYLKSLEKKRFE